MKKSFQVWKKGIKFTIAGDGTVACSWDMNVSDDQKDKRIFSITIRLQNTVKHNIDAI